MMKQSNRCVVLGDQTLRGPPRTGVGVRCGQKGPSGGGQSCQDGPAGPCQSHNCLQSILGYRNKLSLGTEVQTLYSFVNLLPPLYKNKQTLKLTVALEEVVPHSGKFSLNSVRLKKDKGKKLGVKVVTTFILTVITGSSVHTAGRTVLPRFCSTARA